jgi:hypothetical protein
VEAEAREGEIAANAKACLVLRLGRFWAASQF